LILGPVYHICPPLSIRLMGPSLIGDIIVSHLQRPIQAEAVAERRHKQLADVVANQFQGALTPNPGLGVLGKGGEALDLLEKTPERTARSGCSQSRRSFGSIDQNDG
jgi:hypothetical protein